MIARFLAHFGGFLLMLRFMLKRPENARMFWKEFMHQCGEIGIGSLPIVIIISIFLGAVTTIQTAYQLVSPIIPRSAIAQITRDSVILELAPTVLCIVLSGVVGSKIASELGNMRSTEQIDALEIMGVNASNYLIMTKILASLLVIPLLVVISGVLAIWGGRVAGNLSGAISSTNFDIGLHTNFFPYNVFFAMCKAYTFAFIISSISAYYGYNVKGGALEIGRASTTAVVVSCIMILFADYVLAGILLP